MHRLQHTVRALGLGALVAAIPGGIAAAQVKSADSAGAAAISRSVTPATSASTGAPSASRVRQEIELLRLGHDGHIPPADSFSTGSRTVPAGTTVNGSIGITDGTLDVAGRVQGTAVALHGDVIVHQGGLVTGDALSVGGRVILDGGRVEGAMQSVRAPTPGAVRRLLVRTPLTTAQSIKLVLGWFAILIVIGIGVMIFAEANLNGVVAAIESGFSRAFWLGVLGQLVALPALLLLVLGLAITIIGALLIPFAIVVYFIAVAGLVTLGFLAAARLTGGAVVPGRSSSAERGVQLRALMVGVAVYLGLWMVAAAFTWQPVAGAILRGVALAVTWVAATAGLGAALLSRAGTEPGKPRPSTARRPVPDEFAWQTPTPVTGVAAARRPPSVTVKDAP